MFQELPVTKGSFLGRSLVYGVGINDAKYVVQPVINGKAIKCPYYAKWHSMIERCYSVKSQKNRPTYAGCSVCDEWLTFTVFKSWMMQQDWKGNHMDKDLLVQGNKVYSPEFCLFVSHSINLLLNINKSNKGLYPQGVYFNKSVKKYMAKVKDDGKDKYLGTFSASSDAFEAYKKSKYAIIKGVALNQTEPLRGALLNYKIK